MGEPMPKFLYLLRLTIFYGKKQQKNFSRGNLRVSRLTDPDQIPFIFNFEQRLDFINFKFKKKFIEKNIACFKACQVTYPNKSPFFNFYKKKLYFLARFFFNFLSKK